MLRALLVLVISTAAASAVAVPPYEPLPKTKSTATTSAPSSAPAQVGSQSGSVDSTIYSGTDSGFSYAPAVDNSTSSGSVSPSWDALSQIQQMQQEMLELRGMVEELKHQIDIMQKQERERYLDLDMRINQLQSGTAASNGPTTAAVAVPAKGDDKALYEQASDLRKAGKYSEAIAILEQLLQQSPDGLYAPYSEYWLGELFMVADPVDLDQAKRHFINLLAKHPGHAKVPDGMYKLGKLYAGKGEATKAKSTLNELIKQYPDKSAAKLAKDLLKTL